MAEEPKTRMELKLKQANEMLGDLSALVETCGQTIERSMRSFWKRKGHLLCSTCRDRLDSGETSHNEATAPQ